MDFSGGKDFGGDRGERPVDGQTEKRAAKRYASLIRPAKLVCGQGEFVCVIRDVSSLGVSLRTFHGLPTDPTLALELQNGESFEIAEVRREGTEASYRFAEPVAVERLIHENWAYPKRQLRLNLTVPVTVSTLTQRAEGMTLNISQQGARVECDAAFAIDQPVRLESDCMAETRAKVRWRRDSQYGLVFENTFTLRDFAVFAAQVQCPPMLD